MEPVRIFLDTNVVLDYFTGRMGDGAAKVIQIGRNPRYELCISILTAINVLYVSRKTSANLTPNILAKFFTILPQDKKQWDDAQTLGMDDFEDALQASCALNNNCYVAVSRDRHFAVAPMVQFSPEDFVKAVSNSK